MNKKLEPCPFCGNEVELVLCAGVYTFECGNGTGCGQMWGEFGHNKELAIKTWNRRPEARQLSVEELKALNTKDGVFSWVWIELLEPKKNTESAYYKSYTDYTRGRAFCCGYPGILWSFDYSDYGKTWLAFTGKPREEVNANKSHT